MSLQESAIATYAVSAGQTSSGTVLHNEDIQKVYGTAVDTTVHRGGQVVF